MADRFRSKQLELPDPAHQVDRVDLAFFEVDHSGPSFEARVFIGARRAVEHGAGEDHPDYAGSFFVFGHDRCHGEAGHCAVYEDRDPFDFRLPHHLEPAIELVTVTDAVERLTGRKPSRRRAPVDVLAVDARGEPVDALEFSRLRLLTYR